MIVSFKGSSGKDAGELAASPPANQKGCRSFDGKMNMNIGAEKTKLTRHWNACS